MDIKKNTFHLALFTLITLLTFTSCDFLGVNVEESDIIGTWTVDDVSAEITSAGIDITQVLVTTFGYVAADADLILDTLLTDLESEFDATIEFKDDYSYSVLLTDDDDEFGTWSLNTEDKELTLTVSGTMDSDILEVVSVDNNSLVLKLPTEDGELDLNYDGEEETPVSIKIEIVLKK